MTRLKRTLLYYLLNGESPFITSKMMPPVIQNATISADTSLPDLTRASIRSSTSALTLALALASALALALA